MSDVLHLPSLEPPAARAPAPARSAHPLVGELRRELEGRRLSAGALARRTGLAPSTVRTALADGSNPQLATLEAIAAGLDRRVALVPVPASRRRRGARVTALLPFLRARAATRTPAA